MDLLSGALQLAFFAVFAAAFVRFVRRPGPIELAIVSVFATTVAIFLISALNLLAPGISETLSPLAISLLLAQPMLVLRLVGLLRRLPPWALPVAFVGFLAAVAGIVLPPERLVPALLYVALYFIVLEGAAAVLLLREASRRHGLPRFRLMLAGLATAIFGLSIFTAAMGSAAAGGAGSPADVLVISRGLALTAGLGYLAAFVPPRWLRDMGQRAVAFDLATRLVSTPRGTQPVVLWRELCLAARDILGAQRVEVRQGESLLATSDNPRDASSVGGLTPDDSTRRRLVEIPIAGVPEHAFSLRAEVEGTPLFLEDDLAALSLLGAMTQRAADREEAVMRLAEASRELDRTADVRASEALFRALLEAHPNAVLAVDAGGVVAWATGLTAELFGRPAESLGGVRLRELISYDLDSRQPPEVSGILRTEAEGRRDDGTKFPADVAISTFEHKGAGFELVVISDASWRHEADTLRDRFLGVLSHELRTPITAIYGGTQLMLKRGERLDAASREDLLTGVAGEAERLQRIIENLLILARVERGADFFEPRPVLLKQVFSDLVERERQLLPDLTINLTVERGLPLVAADEEYLTLVLRNLLSNAAKYAGAKATVDVVVAEEAGEVTTRVLDDGPGIRPDEADQLFGLYFRSNAGSSAAGAGIGLFVCKGLLSAMNGRVWARQREEGGAEFGFALPVYQDEPVTESVPARAVERVESVQPARLATAESAEAAS